MNDRASFLDELKRLSPAQFEEVMFRLGVEPWIIPDPFAAQVLRSTDLLRRLEQEEGWENLLREVLADRTLETIGKQYEGYETEAEVRTIVRDYVNQPIAGRSQEQEQIDQFLKNNVSGTLLITAPAGFGKSSLLASAEGATAGLLYCFSLFSYLPCRAAIGSQCLPSPTAAALCLLQSPREAVPR